jgi:hypothetical protein
VPSATVFSNSNQNYAAQLESHGRIFVGRQIGAEKGAGQAFAVRWNHHDIGKSIDRILDECGQVFVGNRLRKKGVGVVSV